MISWGQVRKERFCLSTDAFVCPVDKASAVLACFMPLVMSLNCSEASKALVLLLK